jgi:hypothetical protein
VAPASAVTGQSGKAMATLGTGGSKMNRSIAVSTVAGQQGTSGIVNVTGTQLSQVPFQPGASTRGAERVTITAFGASATRSILIGDSDVTVAPTVLVDSGGTQMLNQIVVSSCAPVGGGCMIGGAGQSGNATLSASRGQLF